MSRYAAQQGQRYEPPPPQPVSVYSNYRTRFTNPKQYAHHASAPLKDGVYHSNPRSYHSKQTAHRKSTDNKHDTPDGENLMKLASTLCKEKNTLVKHLASKSKFDELEAEDRRVVGQMNLEIDVYNDYIKALKQASRLNRFIIMVQQFAMERMTDIYLEVNAIFSSAWTMKCSQGL